MTAGDDEDEQDEPAARASAYSARIAERQHDELDPARDDDRRGRAAAPCSSGVAASVSPRPSSGACRHGRALPRPSCSSATSSAALGRRTLLGLLPGAARAPRADVRRRQRREQRGRPRDHAEDRRRAVRGRASTSSRSATTPTTGARSSRTSTAAAEILRPANYLRSQPGPRGRASSSATACGSAS